MIKEIIFKEDITIQDVNAPYKRVSKYMKQKQKTARFIIDEFSIIVGGFNFSLPVIDSSSRWKISNNIHDLNSTINQLDLAAICRILQPTSKTTFFSSLYVHHERPQ